MVAFIPLFRCVQLETRRVDVETRRVEVETWRVEVETRRVELSDQLKLNQGPDQTPLTDGCAE